MRRVRLEELEGASLLQSGFWGALKQAFGWRAWGFEGEGGQVLVLTRRLPGGMDLAYLPHPWEGVETRFRTGGWMVARLREIASLMELKPLFFRVDLPWEERPAGGVLRKAPIDIQPPSTVLVDLCLSDEDLLSSMHHKTRYNLRLAQKKGVVVREEGEEALPLWYRMYEETARRDRIAIHSFEYYAHLFRLARTWEGPKPRVVLFMAYHEGEPLAGNIMALYRERAVYLYGASRSQKRNLMPTYLLQWEAMQWAKGEGALTYDLYGIPPTPDPSHPMYGLYRFKTGFGGRIVHRAGCWDLPLSPLYGLYRTAERVREVYYKRVRKLFRR
ncbi:lipid II:glycine glycyltransferase FemX [Spirochaeta thermophila]|uniref:Protein FemA n=1 Tax=Winmispira thermophila (strain ATCC 49972 / DSM 6192 / RI 19.B1) TaxID=665571 RepID=E0RPA8_WINT6|nr:peptidoglycan bridge formation glycyltransferase FemA/FemB family protein [Spirochaeta thermophila]ADN01302.1 protein FemA [Spirochaeta thermophila DSM 6192]